MMNLDQELDQSTEYWEFDVRIRRAEHDQYRVEVLKSPLGEVSALTKLPVERKDLHEQLAELRLPFTEKAQLVEMGQILYEFLFTPDIIRCWQSSLIKVKSEGKTINFRLRIEDVELSQLPWELLYDPDVKHFLVPALKVSLVRYIPIPEPILPISIRPPLRILLAISNPPDYPQLDVEREKDWITEALTPLFYSNSVSIDILENATRQNLQSWLRRDYHILHYIGHGDLSEDTNVGNLVLTDEETQKASLMDSETLGYLLQYTSIRMVFLNACQTAHTKGAEAFLGVAQSIVRAGVPAVLSMQADIPDTSAAIFARSFYEKLSEGSPVQEAVTEGRKAILSIVGADFKDWSTPVLFMRSQTGTLFKKRGGSGVKVSISGDVLSSSVVTAGRDITIRDWPEDQRSGGKYNIEIKGGQGLVIGDSANITQHFQGDSPLKNESLRRQLKIHQTELKRLEVQALEYVQTDVPKWLLEEIAFTQSEIARLEEELATPSTPEERKEILKIRQLLVMHFNTEELRSLCFDISADYDNLRGEGRENKARELIAYCQRRNRLEQLIQYIRELRPHVTF